MGKHKVTSGETREAIVRERGVLRHALKMANAQKDCHPVGSEYWNPETVDPMDYMPSWMKDHPYYKMELIP